MVHSFQVMGYRKVLVAIFFFVLCFTLKHFVKVLFIFLKCFTEKWRRIAEVMVNITGLRGRD